MDFFIAMKPPTATAQEKQVRIVNGKPIFYDPAPVKDAKKLLIGHLILHKPDKPIEGAVSLTTLCPARNASPLVGRAKPQSILIVVVLPAPFTPKRAKISPFFT